MRTALRNTKLSTGLTVLGAAGIATTALGGTAHAATTPPQTKPAAHATQAAADKDDKKSDKDDKADEKKADKAEDKGKGKDGKSYPDNLDGWIREAKAIMDKHGIPGSYDGIKRNIIRESAGDPNAVNNWDVNAQKGTPSRGLLQVIQPTFDQYHVKGTPDKLTDPVANIVAACNYAADRYGTMDNVDSAY
ncbi:transglycosylase SLT domain-containing protein [Streptomyces tubbatahanensis]|uniref:Transglycosylase SLT domain-containing protein n=1 Tax=Streptomyces tubbatahanensis TaxID=2923272 RepID=A0ABY3Y0H7_9ACTN|nr:transglycosylase SLT domain-containing protein [Streptomyces tubbatahanensis]UNT00121.1 transglycosylase SLT domain-containing protein [Streptomyces tubbatahanensis]